MDISELTDPKSKKVISLYQEVHERVFLDATGFGNIDARISEDIFLYVQRMAKKP